VAEVALLSNPRSTGNRAILPRVRSFCARRPEIFHYEVEEVDQIADAMRTIARVRPKVLVINGGDGTVQAVLTEIHNGGHFGTSVPPVAVLPNGKTNLIALDLGASGDPLGALERILEIAKAGVAPHVVARELIALSGGRDNSQPVFGMFLGGGGLADTILYCRHKIYPLGLPNSLSHLLTAALTLLVTVFGVRGSFLPARPQPLSVTVHRAGEMSGRFMLLMVTTLDRLLFNSRSRTAAAAGTGALKLMAIEERPSTIFRALIAAIGGRLGQHKMTGVHVERGDEIRIEGDRSSIILDGELFETDAGRPIVLTPTAPVSFLSLAA